MDVDPNVNESAPASPEDLSGDAALLDTLHRVATSAVEAIEPVDYAGVTMLVDGEVVTCVFTDPAAPSIDQAQYDSQSGPCLDAYRTGEIFRIASTHDDGPWPEFRAACRSKGIKSTVSFPMTVGDVTHGALNLYSDDYHAFSANEIRLGRAFAAQAGLVMANARSSGTDRRRAQHRVELPTDDQRRRPP